MNKATIEQVRDEISDILHRIGWRSPNDAQWSKLLAALPEIRAALSSAESEPTTQDHKPLSLAVLFHNTYERLAPQFGYKTRSDTQFFDANSANGRLMIAVCAEILSAMSPSLTHSDVSQDGGSGDVAESKDLQLSKVEIAGLESSVNHLSQRADEAIALAEEAVELMTRFHGHATPDDTPDMNAVFPAIHFRNFVDDHARLMFKVAQFKRDLVDPAFLRLKKAADEVCAVMGAHGEICARDDRVQTLMDCLYETDPLKSVYAASQPEAPALTEDAIKKAQIKLQERCKICDGTGAEVGFDGEYLGACRFCDVKRTSQVKEPPVSLTSDEVSALEFLREYRKSLPASLQKAGIGAVIATLAARQPAALTQPAAEADELEAFEQWAKKEGLIQESFGVRSVNSMCDVAKLAWQARAALAQPQPGEKK